MTLFSQSFQSLSFPAGLLIWRYACFSIDRFSKCVTNSNCMICCFRGVDVTLVATHRFNFAEFLEPRMACRLKGWQMWSPTFSRCRRFGRSGLFFVAGQVGSRILHKQDLLLVILLPSCRVGPLLVLSKNCIWKTCVVSPPKIVRI